MPPIKVLETLPITQVEHYKGTNRSLEEYFTNAVKLFLAKGIPDVQVRHLLRYGIWYLKQLVIYLNFSGAPLVLVKSVLHISVGDASLSHHRVAD